MDNEQSELKSEDIIEQSKLKSEDKPANQSSGHNPDAPRRLMKPPDQMSDTAILVEGAMMAALGFVLSLIPFFHMPWGGSITCFSTLPIIVMSLRHGMKRGVFTAAVYGVIQAIQGAGTVALAGSAGAMALCVLLDYFLAYAAVGLTGPIARLFVKRRSSGGGGLSGSGGSDAGSMGRGGGSSGSDNGGRACGRGGGSSGSDNGGRACGRGGGSSGSGSGGSAGSVGRVESGSGGGRAGGRGGGSSGSGGGGAGSVGRVESDGGGGRAGGLSGVGVGVGGRSGGQSGRLDGGRSGRLDGARVAGLTAGIVATGLMRLACSFVSGILIWGAWAPEGTPVWRYSLGYNAGWCLPDVAIVLIAAIALSGAPVLHILELPHD